MSEPVDVVVLGAGVVGLSTARHLSLRGARVTLLDPSSPGGRGSRAAAGVGIPSFRLLDDPELLAFARQGWRVLSEDLSSLGDAALRRGSGILRVAMDDKGRKAMEDKAASVPGWLGRWVGPEEVAALEPALAGAQIAGAYAHDDAFMVDTEAYLNSLLQDLPGRGVDVRLGESAVGVTEEAGRVRVRTERAELLCDRVVVAAGAWSGAVPGLPPLPVKPQRGQMMVVMHPRLRLSRVVSGAAYLAPWRSGEVVVGATEEDAGFAEHPTPAGLLHLSAVVARLSPGLREARFVRAWAGLRSTTPSGRPLLGAWPGTARVLLASGHGGQGIMTGGLSGRGIAELLDTGRSDVLEPFTPARVLTGA
ncbi:FAD-dependent oxidoreductase [Myxococcaceae bacterium GXIMD 01537]